MSCKGLEREQFVGIFSGQASGMPKMDLDRSEPEIPEILTAVCKILQS